MVLIFYAGRCFVHNWMSMAAFYVLFRPDERVWLRPLNLAWVSQICGFPRPFDRLFFARLFCACALEGFVDLLVAPGMLMVPVMWPTLLRCGACSPLGLQCFCTMSRLVSAFRWISVHSHVFMFWSCELFPWTQVEQHCNVSFCVCISRRTL